MFHSSSVRIHMKMPSCHYSQYYYIYSMCSIPLIFFPHFSCTHNIYSTHIYVYILQDKYLQTFSVQNKQVVEGNGEEESASNKSTGGLSQPLACFGP